MCVCLCLCVCFCGPTSLACSLICPFARLSVHLIETLSLFRCCCLQCTHRMHVCELVVCGIRELHLDNNVQYGRAHNALYMQPNMQSSSLLLSSFTSRTQCNCLIFSLHPRQTYTRPYQLLLLPPSLMLHYIFNCILYQLCIYINRERKKSQTNNKITFC